MSEDKTWYDFLSASYEMATKDFAFLESLGFRLVESVEATGNNSRYDGWHFALKGPIDIKVEYYEWEFNVIFTQGETTVSYWYLDKNVFDNQSGFQGSMFGPENIQRTLEETSQDIKDQYEDILLGNPSIWKKITELLDKTRIKMSAMRLEEDRKNAFRFERIDAKEAFQKKNYKKVVELLKGADEYLTPVEMQKLNYARKKLKAMPWWKKI